MISEKPLKLISHLTETFANSKKVGFLKLYENGWINDHYQEYIFVLTNSGLVYFDNTGVFNCKGFIPILGARISGNLVDKRLDHRFVVLISFDRARVFYKIAGHSYLDIEEWSNAI